MGDEEPRPRRKKSKKKRAPLPEAPPLPPVAEGWAPPWLSYLATGLAAFYLLLVYADASGWQWLGNKLPQPLHYFGQVAALFPEADKFATEYYAEGWLCREQRWVELDTRPWFPIDADEKENRFSRAVGFYSRPPTSAIRLVMNGLDDYVTERENRARRDANGDAPDLIGGVRIWRISFPLPTFGDHVERYFRRKFVDVPAALKTRKGRAPARQYYTKISRRFERCKGFYPEYDDRALVEDLERGEKSPDEPQDHGPEALPADVGEP